MGGPRSARRSAPGSRGKGPRSGRRVRARPGLLPASPKERGRPLLSVAHRAVSLSTSHLPLLRSDGKEECKRFSFLATAAARLWTLLLPFCLLWGGKGVTAEQRCCHSRPFTPVPLDRTASLGSDRKPPGQSLGRSCQCECRVCREWGEERVSPAPLNA